VISEIYNLCQKSVNYHAAAMLIATLYKRHQQLNESIQTALLRN